MTIAFPNVIEIYLIEQRPGFLILWTENCEAKILDSSDLMFGVEAIYEDGCFVGLTHRGIFYKTNPIPMNSTGQILFTFGVTNDSYS
ncbi:MAG: hypothetical protein WC891_02865 [Actinomycetota bacterium]